MTFEQASGREKIDPLRLESLQKLNKMVIAHRGKNLTSVSPKALEPEEEASE